VSPAPAHAAAGDARKRLPREPYPGLRPFLDFEAALLFGRERQVREVIDRLNTTQFVAVLGGSGSGKSSLIHAGVVPELRSFGIPGAGDLWLPMTCTPGTNVTVADSDARRHSPVTRLARRFAGLLKPRGDEAADNARINDIADVFRQEAGFARLMDAYGPELAVPPGPDPGEARVLFVLDQFEEIFHPTNKGVADATLLVERMLDHFFNPHPRCYVVLTMRSEHLNDCAAFLELPDAINKSSYLIRRLDDGELRDAITGPAQRFLRLVARSQADAPPGAAVPPAAQCGCVRPEGARPAAARRQGHHPRP
jgi:energy-coupling factor transporter ATP-binding protein EcfA2